MTPLMSLLLFRLLDPHLTVQYDTFKEAYASLLYRWGLREKRAEVLKYVSVAPDDHSGIGRSWFYGI